jgi:hypothetical protein
VKWPVIYSDKMPDGVAGQARGLMIFIRPAYRGDEGLYQHELEHVIQFVLAGLLAALFILACVSATGGSDYGWAAAGWCAHPLLYTCVRRYRLICEVEAYREQRRHPDRKGNYLTADDAASRLRSPGYGFNLSQAEALAQIKGI